MNRHRKFPTKAGRLAAISLGLMCLLSGGCASQDLGYGYRLVARQEEVRDPNFFEAIAHYTDLYHGLRKLGSAVGQHSISPSGNYAAFVEGALGRILLFDKRAGTLTDITDGEFAIPSDFDWSEADDGVLSIRYYEDHEPSVITLAGKSQVTL